MTVERITEQEFRARMKAQDVEREHVAFKCPICGTVQSLASLIRAGATTERAERMAGSACEGRLTDAGPWPSSRDTSARASFRRAKRGCDWTLHGLLHLHRLEVVFDDHPKPQFAFEVATPDEAQALRAQLEETSTS